MQKSPLSSRILWTRHALEKMKFYRLSQARVKRVLYHPDRVEEGIALNTIASMQKAGSQKHPYEIWAMYQKISSRSSSPKINLNLPKLRVISAWRYPGESPEGKRITIPEDVQQDLISLGILKNYA